MPNVAFIHNVFPAGGAERITQDIACHLHKTDSSYSIFVYATCFKENAHSESLTCRQIPRKGRKRADAVEKLILQDKIDILVQVTSPVDDIAGIRKRTGCKAVLANHGEPFWQRYTIINRRRNTPIKRILWKLFNEKRYIDNGLAEKMAIERSWDQYNDCDAYTVLCEAYRRQTAQAFGIDAETSHIRAIENPENTVENLQLQKEKIVLFCGRLERWSKRIDRLLRIWGKVQERLPDWKMVIIGDGPDRKALEHQADKDGLKRVIFAGMQNDVGQFYRKASVVALTSQTEGWPLALSEASANGCIPVAFGCTEGIRELLSPDGTNGFIVTPFDEDEFADTLIRIAEMSEEEQNRIRISAINKRKEYTPEKIVLKWKELFEELINTER